MSSRKGRDSARRLRGDAPYPQLRKQTSLSHFGTWVCDMCYPDVEELGMIAPGISLIVWHGQYALIGGQGHSDSEIVIFNESPYADPAGYDEEDAFAKCRNTEQVDVLTIACERWENAARIAMAARKRYDLLGEWRFVENLREAGYSVNKDGDAELWLFHQCGKLIAAATAAEEATND